MIQDNLFGRARWLLFRRPTDILTTRDINNVDACLRGAEERTREGLYAAGFVAYEAAGALDPALRTHVLNDFPLIWLGIYSDYELIALPRCVKESTVLDSWQTSVTPEEYHRAFERIKEHISRGNTYQVNYTLRLRHAFSGDPWRLFLSLQSAQRSAYAAYLNLGRHHICSASPELFFSLDRGRLVSKPMKGTAPRGDTTADDRRGQEWLARSAKNRAENVMIVDMIRSDMGRVADAGTVCVDKLFSIERYPTILQMTSTVTSRASGSVTDILRAMFPCASITGAPKVKTMEIIKELESSPRGIYTGSIGYFGPDRRAQFNVAIRTAVADTEKRSVEFGVGGGIVWDSDEADEYAEWRAKARILFDTDPQFDLVESLLWRAGGGFYLLDPHVARLEDSAAYFQFKFSAQNLRKVLLDFAAHPPQRDSKVRIRLAREGRLVIRSESLNSITGATLALTAKPVKKSRFLLHKTTHREQYAELLQEHRGRIPELTDLIYWNEDGLVTETGFANVVVDIDGVFCTPRVEAGALPGIFRQYLLGLNVIQEREVRVDDLVRARNLYLINSVRGWMPLMRAAQADVWTIMSDLDYETNGARMSHGVRGVVSQGVER